MHYWKSLEKQTELTNGPFNLSLLLCQQLGWKFPNRFDWTHLSKLSEILHTPPQWPCVVELGLIKVQIPEEDTGGTVDWRLNNRYGAHADKIGLHIQQQLLQTKKED